jgi:hypothetical protein
MFTGGGDSSCWTLRDETAEQIARIAESLRTLHSERYPEDARASGLLLGAAGRRG